MYDTLQITPLQSIENGDSGSWVFCSKSSGDAGAGTFVTRDRLTLETIGMVIAGGGIFPWAYMLPVNRILQDVNISLQVFATIPPWSDVVELATQMWVELMERSVKNSRHGVSGSHVMHRGTDPSRRSADGIGDNLSHLYVF